MLGPAPSASGEPSIWYAEVAAPHRKPSGKRAETPIRIGRSLMANVKLVGVRKIYEERGRTHVAVHDLDLDIGDGEFVVLVGPTGCGKSTTLRMIAGLESISAG